MEVTNCRECGRLFNYMGGSQLCPACQKRLEEKFQQVKVYLDDHPNALIHEVAEDMQVSVKQIKQWIKEERLALSAAGADGIVCEQCGAPICTGRFCEKCKVNMVNTLSRAIEKPKVQESKKQEHDHTDRMRFL